MTAPKIVQFPHRQWNGGKVSTMADNWDAVLRSPDVDIRHGLSLLRARARDAAQNVDHVRGFLSMVESNVIGRQGIVLQSRAKLRNGKPDHRIQSTVEDAWKKWVQRGITDVTGQSSFKSLTKQAVRTAARDGEAIFRIVEGWNNGFGFALQQIDPECLDVRMNQTRDGKRSEIRMGIEFDEWRRPVAYHLTDEPSIQGGGYQSQSSHERVPASEIIHVFLPEWTWQSRGVPWISTGLLRLHMLEGYEDAAITAARVAAAKMGFYRRQPDASPMPEEESGDGDLGQDVSPGTFERLPEGWDFVGWDPAYPNTSHGEFVKSCLRSIATGLGVNYNALANDLEGVNYSSLRQGAIIERDMWMMVQEWFIESFCDRVLQKWLDWILDSGVIAIPEAKHTEARRVAWQPRRWQWVDPLKDIKANEEAIRLRVRSISDVIRETGRDPQDVWDELESDMAELEARGIPIESVISGQQKELIDDADQD